MYTRVVVGLDGSDLSESALRDGAALAKALGVPLHLVRVADLANVRWGSSEASDAYAALSQEMEHEKVASTSYLDVMAAPLRDDGLTVTTEVRSGTAARELLKIAGPDDLIVVASHGRHGLERLLLGSVAEEVARKAPGPVLITRAG
ncbi:MAG: universal stress protein [Thermomicrobiales bacterium]|nr:universal stress protein [Thermomicrobiales bacterium]